MAPSVLDILIRAKNQASGELKRVTTELRGMDKATKLAVGGLSALAGSFAAAQAARFAVEMANLNTQMERSAFAFEHFSGGAAQAEANLRAVQRASGGMLTTFDAQNLAVTAMTQGLASTSAELERVTKIARGIVAVSPIINDLESAFGQLGLTIANQSVQRLDQLGTSASEVIPKVEQLKSTNKDLSDQMAFQIALMDTLESKHDPLLEAAVNSASGLERLTVALKQQRAVLASYFGWLDSLAGDFADIIDRQAVQSRALELMANPPASASPQQLNIIGQMAQQFDLLKKGVVTMDEAELRIMHLVESYDMLADAAVQSGQAEAAAAKAAATEMEMAYQAHQQKVAAYNQMIEQAGQRAFQSVYTETGNANLAMLAYEQTINQIKDTMRDLPETFQTAETALMILPAVVARVGEEISARFTFGAEATTKLDDAAQRLGSTMQKLEIFAGGAAAKILSLSSATIVAKDNAVNFVGAVEAAFSAAQKVYDGPLGLSKDQKGEFNKPSPDKETKQLNAELANTLRTASAVNSEFESLKSTISGIVTGAIGPVAGVDANDLLPRPDAVNENARRLADIAVNGLKGQNWLSEFAAEVPGVWDEIANSGDPQGTAARILKDFQDGLRPELLDKERAKELVKRALQGDANTKALIDEIAADLASELGISLSQAKEAASSVLGGGTEAGSSSVSLAPKIDTGAASSAAVSFSSAFVGAIESGSLGADLGAALMVQVTSSVALVEQTGKDAGDVFVRGFTGSFDGIPAAFIAAVVSLAMPGIMANMSSNGGRTGAADV